MQWSCFVVASVARGGGRAPRVSETVLSLAQMCCRAQCGGSQVRGR